MYARYSCNDFKPRNTSKDTINSRHIKTMVEIIDTISKKLIKLTDVIKEVMIIDNHVNK